MRKPSNCKCGRGGFRTHGQQWRVLVRRPWPGTCRIKCLVCGWKWWVRRRWAGKLTDHVEESRSGLTDSDILERLENDTLIVCRSGRAVLSRTVQGTTELKVITRRSNGSVYRFVEITARGKKKKIAVHRLVWMSVHRQLVPPGFDVDHVNGKNLADPDCIDNLRLLESSRNRARGRVSPTPELPFNDEDPF